MNNDYHENEYTPNGTKYAPSSASGTTTALKKRSVWPMIGAIVGVLLAMALMIYGTALYVSYQYEQILGEMMSSDDRPSDDLASDDTDAPSFLPSGDDVKIVISETAPPPTKGSVGDSDLALSDVVSLVGDTVVEIVTSEANRNGLVYESGAGSGVIVNESGVILTNHHVIESASAINVRLTNGNTYTATLVASDAESDLAILKIEPTETLKAAVFGKSDNVVAGEAVIAIGNPLGLLGGTVTDGIISATSREVSVEGGSMTLLQHNAAISPGNSGGALFNMRGELIGIVNAKYSSDGAEGLGFAIPSDTVVSVYEDLITYGYVKGRPDTGVTLGGMYYNYFNYVICVTESRYTDELKPYDVLISIDGVTPTSLAEAKAMLGSYEIGDTVTFVVSRTEGRAEVRYTVTVPVREYEP